MTTTCARACQSSRAPAAAGGPKPLRQGPAEGRVWDRGGPQGAGCGAHALLHVRVQRVLGLQQARVGAARRQEGVPHRARVAQQHRQPAGRGVDALVGLHLLVVPAGRGPLPASAHLPSQRHCAKMFTFRAQRLLQSQLKSVWVTNRLASESGWAARRWRVCADHPGGGTGT